VVCHSAPLFRIRKRRCKHARLRFGSGTAGIARPSTHAPLTAPPDSPFVPSHGPHWVRLGAARTPCLPGRHRWSVPAPAPQRRLFVPVPTRLVGPLATPLPRRLRRHHVHSEFSGSRVAYLPVARSANTAATSQRRARPPAHRRSPRQPHRRAPPLRGLILPVASTGVLWTARADRTPHSIAGLRSRIGAAWLRARRSAASSGMAYLRVMRGGWYNVWCKSATPHEGALARLRLVTTTGGRGRGTL
jgi:hypothetical protein